MLPDLTITRVRLRHEAVQARVGKSVVPMTWTMRACARSLTNATLAAGVKSRPHPTLGRRHQSPQRISAGGSPARVPASRPRSHGPGARSATQLHVPIPLARDQLGHAAGCPAPVTSDRLHEVHLTGRQRAPIAARSDPAVETLARAVSRDGAAPPPSQPSPWPAASSGHDQIARLHHGDHCPGGASRVGTSAMAWCVGVEALTLSLDRFDAMVRAPPQARCRGLHAVQHRFPNHRSSRELAETQPRRD